MLDSVKYKRSSRQRKRKRKTDGKNNRETKMCRWACWWVRRKRIWNTWPTKSFPPTNQQKSNKRNKNGTSFVEWSKSPLKLNNYFPSLQKQAPHFLRGSEGPLGSRGAPTRRKWGVCFWRLLFPFHKHAIQVTIIVLFCEFYFYRIFMDTANSHTKSYYKLNFLESFKSEPRHRSDFYTPKYNNILRSFEAKYVNIIHVVRDGMNCATMQLWNDATNTFVEHFSKSVIRKSLFRWTEQNFHTTMFYYCCTQRVQRIREGELPYITDGDARPNFRKQPLKVTILGVAPANFIP